MRPCAVSKPPHSVHGSPWASSEVHWFHSSLAHEWRTMATLLVLSRDTCYTEWTGWRVLAKMPKPGDLSVLGLRLGNDFTRRDHCQLFIRAASPGSGRRAHAA
jgi:hypothetical protein